MREEKYLDQHENHSENKERDDFPACEPCQIMAKKKERKTNRRNDPWPCRPRNFELQIRTEDSAQEQQWRERSDPKRDVLEPSGLDRHNVAFESGLFGQIGNRIRDAFCE